MNKVTYFDVEYANAQNKALCQIGIVCENYATGDPIFPELDIYINPEDRFDNNCVKIHGITSKKVADAPAFPKVWEQIEPYFTNAVVIGHNVASSDLDSLVKNLKRYNLDIPELYYICTYELALRYVPSYAVKNYTMSALCEYFDIDLDSEHNAFDDACACADLFKALVKTYGIDADSCIKKYDARTTREFSAYISAPELRKSISEFFGVIRGFSIDNDIAPQEVAYIQDWRETHLNLCAYKEIRDIIAAIDKVLADGAITLDEMVQLQCAVKAYLDVVSTSSVTLATQILDGVLRGITVDGEITEAECKNLRQWLYDNIHLSDHFPFDEAIKLVDRVLDDGVITREESDYLTAFISRMLNPVESLKSQVNSVEGKTVCLSGTFAKGKAHAEKYITERGGIVEPSVKKITDFLIVGDGDCLAYSNGTYGTKVKKALEYNKKGCNIKIVKESDFFANIK